MKFICSECQKVYCKNCLASHNKNNPKHNTNNIDKSEFICPVHDSTYTHYCFDCKKNLCDECMKEKKDNHQIIYFKNINLKNNELTEFKNNLEKENELLFKIKKIFNDTLSTLSNKFNDIISYKFLCLKYKNNIINSYENNDPNYQIIDNINHLKFITKELKIEPEMNELDIIYELFNFLDSIEYNEDMNNGNNNYNNNMNDQMNFQNMDYRVNGKNKMIFDQKNKIEESENEDENENENENESKNNFNENENKKESENIKVEENEKEEEEDEEKKDELGQKVIESEEYKPKIEYIKISDSSKKNDNEIKNEKDEDEDEDKENININKNISRDGQKKETSPSKITKKIKIEKVTIDEDIDTKEDIPLSERKEGPNNNEKIENKNLETKENESDNDEENDENNIYIYKSNRHIPVVTEYNNKQEIQKEEKLNKTEGDDENKEKEPKKKKKKIIKKKKIKISAKPAENEKEEKTIIKTKKKILKKMKIKDDYTEEKPEKEEEKPKDEDKDKEEENIEKEEEIPKEKEKIDDEEKDEDKDKLNNNIHIEINESDSQEIINNLNIEEKKNGLKKKGRKPKYYNEERTKDSNIHKSNDYLSISDDHDHEHEPEKSQDFISNEIISYDITSNENVSNVSNDYKIEEVQNYTQEDSKGNKKRTKVIKKKKKKKLNITKVEHITQPIKQVEIINTENVPISDSLRASLERNIEDKQLYKNRVDKVKNKDEIDIDGNLIDSKDYKTNEDKTKKPKTSSIKIKNSTITKKLNFFNSDDKEEKDDNDDESADKNFNIQVNDISEDNSEVKNSMEKISNIINIDLNGDIDINKKSPLIKKRKKIKKKKFLISVDNKAEPKRKVDDKQIKITKKTTLLRSKSKDNPKGRKVSNDTYDYNTSNEKKQKKEFNFKIYKNASTKSPGYSQDYYNTSNSFSRKEREMNNIKKINDIKDEINNTLHKAKHKRRMRMTQGKNNAALLLQNTEEVYLAERSIRRFKKSGLNELEKEIQRDLNRSVDEATNRNIKNRRLKREFNYDEIKYLVDRSNSYKKSKKYKHFGEREKINCIKFENGISCLLEINPEIFALGNLIGDILIINSLSYKEILVIREHDGTIISLCLLSDRSILSCSADRKMLKIRISPDGTKYKKEFLFYGYENYILKAIELSDTYRIVTCSWDDKLFVWEKENEMNYRNTLRFNEGERVVDLIEINPTFFVTISENNELKYWNSENFELIDSIKNIKCNGSPNVLCKINDIILCVIDYHEIQIVDITSHQLVNRIAVDDGNLSCIIKLKDGSILVAEDYNNDRYCLFYMKQFYYENYDLQPISSKKDKFYKTNKSNDKEIRALIQFSNGVIVQGVTGEYNGKDSGDLFFYY